MAFGFVSGLLSVALAVLGIGHQVRRLIRGLPLYLWRRTHGFILVRISVPLIVIVIAVVIRRAVRAPIRRIVKGQSCVVKSEPEATAPPPPPAVTSVISVASSPSIATVAAIAAPIATISSVTPAPEMTAPATRAAAPSVTSAAPAAVTSASSLTSGGEAGLAPTKGYQ